MAPGGWGPSICLSGSYPLAVGCDPGWTDGLFLPAAHGEVVREWVPTPQGGGWPGALHLPTEEGDSTSRETRGWQASQGALCMARASAWGRGDILPLLRRCECVCESVCVFWGLAMHHFTALGHLFPSHRDRQTDRGRDTTRLSFPWCCLLADSMRRQGPGLDHHHGEAGDTSLGPHSLFYKDEG